MIYRTPAAIIKTANAIAPTWRAVVRAAAVREETEAGAVAIDGAANLLGMAVLTPRRGDSVTIGACGISSGGVSRAAV